MMLNKYKEQYAYKLSDVIAYGLANMTDPYTAQYPKADNTTFKRELFGFYGLLFPISTDIPVKYIDEDHLGLLNKVIERYWDEYVFQSEELMEDNSQIHSYPDILYKTRRFLGKFIDIVENTYQKYTALLSSYDTAKTKLLDKLERISNGEDTRRDNDTPQDGGDFTDDNHTSYYSHGTTDVTESHDDTPIIERLDKIQNLYKNVMYNWLNEFKDLFIEEGNIHEI